MKKLLFLLTVLCWGVAAQGQGIRFEKSSFDEALAKARKENKMVFVDAYAVWCGPCKWMDKNVFKEKEVGEFFDEHIVAVKIDVERGEGPSVKTRYAIEGLPGYLFLDSKGNIVFRGSGAMSSEKFMDMVKEAQKALADPNSLGRLSARYSVEKNDEQFLSQYLSKLKSSGSAGYYDVVEQYLKIQQTMKPESREMVMFLYDHADALIFGGMADDIIRKNLGSEAWDEYVWKDVRQCFQELPKKMAYQTAEYAIVTKDTSWLGVSCRRAAEEGIPVAEDQMDRLFLHYYLQTNDAAGYKRLAKPQLDEFYNSLDVEDLKRGHQVVLEKMRKDPTRQRISFAEINSDKLRTQISEYARFANVEEDGKDVLRWARRAYDLVPDMAKNVSFYAKALYLFGDKEEGMKLMTEAVRLGEAEKNAEGYRKDLELMKAGGQVFLTF